MRTLNITYRAVKRNENGDICAFTTQNVKLPVLEEIAADALTGRFSLTLSLALQHIAELTGYQYAGVIAVSVE